jgi:hypothetical protein
MAVADRTGSVEAVLAFVGATGITAPDRKASVKWSVTVGFQPRSPHAVVF